MWKNPQWFVGFIFLIFAFIVEAKVDIINYKLQRNDLDLHLALYQNADIAVATTYPDILMVHGLTYSSHQFDVNVADYSLARAFANMGFRVWLLDITGYGQSEKPHNGFLVDSAYAAEDIHLATDFILKKQNIAKINIFGWSWGTITSSQFVANYPNKVHRLVLFAPIIYGVDLPLPTTDYYAFDIVEAQADFPKTADNTIDFDKVKPGVFELYLANVKKFDGKGSPNGGRRDLFQNAQLIPYEQIHIPTLLIAGTADPYLNAESTMAQILQSSPHACAHIFEGGSHILFLEKAYYKEFQRIVGSFFKEMSILSGGH